MKLEPAITAGERMYVVRRRRGWTQSKAARMCGTYRSQYQLWEADAEDGAPDTPVGCLSTEEMTLLLRRRAGLTQQQLADAIGCSRQWLVMMERGLAPIDTLTTFWELHDQRRPRGRG